MKTQPADPFQLNLNVDETALALRVSPRTVRKLIAQGQLPIVRLGRRVLVPRQELIAWLKSRTEAAK